MSRLTSCLIVLLPCVTLRLTALEGDLLWNAGRTSAEYLEQRAAELVEGKDILEIGAAAGVPSIVCAIKGARTVVMTDYPDPDLVNNMRQNAASATPLIPDGSHLHVAGYKWGAPTDEIMSYLPSGSQGFDLLIMADVVYSHREHGNLISTMQRTLKKSPDAIALVIFTPYQPWLLPKTEKFFPLAEENGFKVTKLFEKLMDKVLFENDPGVCNWTGRALVFDLLIPLTGRETETNGLWIRASVGS